MADFAGIGQPRAHGGVGRSAREADGAWTAKGVRVRSYPSWGELSIARTITVVVESAAERWLNATYFAVKWSKPYGN